MIGIDICDVTRFDKLSANDAFLHKVFTDDEIAYCGTSRNASQRFAARFAAKEAFSKAVGTGFGKSVSFSEVEVIKSEAGQPAITLHGKTAQFFSEEFAGKQIHLSISHEKTMAVAVVVLL
ncbi:MAG: holo-ACP synthase [Spirochaetales bacterium]|nr:holo-ACP synthase [Spirochaetales bacterium]